ncbi:uncharacterized protein [Palaemon carinicauda]|uniref:uncharacterized protein n=1 Tax=Palaemon carinicauda TaxID=392227 RepID=UPI0035B69E05
MKSLIVASLCIAMALGQTQVDSNFNVRVLPANVSPDAPNACYGSTARKSFEVGQTWFLNPICGRSTCLQDGSRLFERIEDCGQPPNDSPGCRLSNEPDIDQTYPACCPVYECQPGAELQYPTEEELRAAAQQAAQQAAQAAQGAQAA